MEIIKTAILSLIAIAIIHHLYLMFKNNLTVPKTKFIDPENTSSTYTPTPEPHITATSTTIEIGDTTSINDLVSLDTTENVENEQNEQNEQKTQLKDYIKNITVTSLDN